MDQNGHMRTVAYLEIAEDSSGYSMDSFVFSRARRGAIVKPEAGKTKTRPAPKARV